jgi:hypothetical protein
VLSEAFTDDELVFFIEALPSEEELTKELAPLFPQRICAVCGRSLALYRRDAIACSNRCRTKRWRASPGRVLSA